MRFLSLCHFVAMSIGLALAIIGCGPRQSTAAQAQQTERPASVEDWESASPASENLDPELIAAMVARVRDGSYKNIHGILLVRNGKLVVEEYFPGQDSAGKLVAFDRNTVHEMHSATKSVNSLLIGIAIDQGLIHSVDEKIATFLPQYADIFADKGKAAITLKDCLSMTAGLAWDEELPYTDPRNDHVAMNASPDPIRFVLQRPLVAAPGSKFNYNSGVSIMLGEVIHKASGQRADDFAREHLFAPLGIRDYYWFRYPNQTVQTGGGLSLRPRDMAKIGMLALGGGRWRGKQIVSEAWIRESIRQQAPDQAYGYQWWLVGDAPQPSAAYAALGRGGQLIIVIPELNMVAVFTGWNDGPVSAMPPLEMMKRYILPAAAKIARRSWMGDSQPSRKEAGRAPNTSATPHRGEAPAGGTVRNVLHDRLEGPWISVEPADGAAADEEMRIAGICTLALCAGGIGLGSFTSAAKF